MNGKELIILLNEKIPTTINKVKSVVGALLTTIFLRQNVEVTEFEKVKAGMFKEVLTDLLESGKLTYIELYKAKNFLAIAEKADALYSHMHCENNSDEYDFDWFVRFYEAAGNISDETMQNLWAKILAGEIAQPQSCSLKTLDVLKNMSKKDAELFNKICSYSFVTISKKVGLPTTSSYLKKYEIQYGDIMKLNEQGLIFNDTTIKLEININNSPKILFTNQKLLMTIATKDGKEKMASIYQYHFTNAGKELALLIDNRVSNEIFIEYCKSLTKENTDYKIAVHRVVCWKEDSVEYEEENLIE